MIFKNDNDGTLFRHLDYRWHGVHFIEEHIEQAYQEERKEGLRTSRSVYIFFTFICALTPLIDQMAMSESVIKQALMIRFSLLILPNILVSLLFRLRLVQAHLDDIYLGVGMCAVTCVNALQYIAPMHDIAFHYYVFGHFITIIAFYAMTFLPLRFAHSITALGVAEYIAVRLLRDYGQLEQTHAVILQGKSLPTVLVLFAMFWVTAWFIGLALRVEVRRSFFQRLIIKQKHQEIEVQQAEMQAQNDEIMRTKILLEEQAEIIADANHELKIKHLMIEEEQEKSEALLTNMLPASIAKRLRNGEKIIVDKVDFATVLFADLVGFTKLASSVTPETVLVILNSIYSAFDDIVEQYHIEKVKTIGDSYMAVGGVPDPHPDHIRNMCVAAQEFIAAVERINVVLDLELSVRIGIHCGEVVAGVIGSKKVAYDLWGDTVNIASRMESHGVPGKIHISEAVYAMIHHEVECIPHGMIDIKGKGQMQTWFLST